MARPRTPSNILDLRGAFKKDPQRGRDREDEPEPKAPVGDAPEHFTDEQKAAWKYIVGIAPLGVLGDSDRAYLEIAAELFALKRDVGVKEMESSKLNRLETMLSKLGLNPADRSRVKVGGRPLAPAQRGNAFGNLG